MKKLILSLAILSLSSYIVFGQLSNKPLGSTTSSSGYIEYLPSGYSNNSSQKLPVIIFFHGSGEGGNGKSDLYKIYNTGLPRIIRENVTNKNSWKKYENQFVVLMPQHDETKGLCMTEFEIRDFIDFARAHYNVDLSRVYLTGLSCGANGLWRYIGSNPTNAKVAAAVPISGNSLSAFNKAGCNITIPLWAFHGGSDQTSPVKNDIAGHNGFAACPAPHAEASLKVYPGVEHNCWDMTYDLSGGYDIFAWMLKHASPSPNVNHTPIDINISYTGFNENLPLSSLVGILSTVDPDNGDAFTYSLEDGGTINDKALFKISGNNLQTNAMFDFETKVNYRVKVRSTDKAGAFKEKWFDLTVFDVYEAPVTSWDFNTKGDFEGWNMKNNITGDANGFTLATTITGADPYILSPSGLNATTTQYKYVYIALRNYTSQTQGELYWTTNNSGSFDGNKRILFDLPANDGQYHDVLIDLSSVGTWVDLITQLRIDPMTTGSSGEIRFNHISFEKTNKLDCAGIWNGTTPQVLPTVTIEQITGTNPSCAGESVSFSATRTNGGSAPSYQWKSNGFNVGTNSDSYVSVTLSDGAMVTCVMTSNAQCASTPKATSNGIKMTRNALVVPTISIDLTNGANPSCTGDALTFTATRKNGGSSPTYQWKVDGTVQATTNATFTSTILLNNAKVTCVLTSNARCASATSVISNEITIKRSTGLTPTVTIIQTTGANPSCVGESLTFSASQKNGGATPIYQWKVDGVNKGSTSVFTSNTITNNQVVSCVMTSTATCVSATTATSNNITVNRSSSLIPTVAIIQTVGANPSCADDALTFNATSTNGGLIPGYQWKVDGVNKGSTATFTTSAITNNQVVTCLLTSTATCVVSTTVGSNSITIKRNALITPTISIAQTVGANPSCAGEALTFSATSTNDGGNPSYQWKVDGVNKANNATFTSSDIANNQVVSCFVTSSATCVSTPTVSSNNINIKRTALVTPTVAIAQTAGPNPSCVGDALTFTASATNGGGTPKYQWKVDGLNQGTNSVNFTSNTLSNNLTVTCVMTSNLVCVNASTANSNGITVQVKDKPKALAGIDAYIVNNTVFNLDGNTVVAGETGTWSTTSAATIETATNSSSSVSGLDNADGTFRWTVGNGTCSIYDEVIVHAGSLPAEAEIQGEINIVPGVTYTYSVTPESGVTYNWDVSTGGTITSNGGNEIQVVFDSGLDVAITLTMSNSFGTVQQYSDVQSTVPTGITASKKSSVQTSVYPTPFNDIVYIKIESVQKQGMHITVSDMSGKLILTSDAYQTNERIELGENLSDGMYLVQAQFGSEIAVMKIVKQKR